jgi:hypothetical protein
MASHSAADKMQDHEGHDQDHANDDEAFNPQRSWRLGLAGAFPGLRVLCGPLVSLAHFLPDLGLLVL